MRLAFQLAVRNGIETNFAKEMKRREGSGWKIFYVGIHKFQLEPLKVFHSQEREVLLLKQ
jgi:hypothetical protein